MSVTPRLVLTATAAGTLLCGLCFIPSAHADEGPALTHRQAAASAPAHPATGGVDTTPARPSVSDPR